jgi:hypothetical protein
VRSATISQKATLKKLAKREFLGSLVLDKSKQLQLFLAWFFKQKHTPKTSQFLTLTTDYIRR